MNKKKTIILLVIGILVVTTMSIGVTYSYMKPKAEKENNQTEIGINNCAKITLKDNDSTINLTNMYPMEEEMGLQTPSYEFTISSTCEEYTGFNLYLTTLNDNEIKDKDIRYAVTDVDDNVLITDLISNKPNGITEFSEEEIKELEKGIENKRGNTYKVYNSVIPLDKERTYKLHIWIDENANNDTMNESFKIKVSIKEYDWDGTLTEYLISTKDRTLIYHNELPDYRGMENYELEAGDLSYRYSGSSEEVNNYICFGGDCSNDSSNSNYANLYRIIGLFDDNQDGNYNIKIIAADYLTSDLSKTDGAYIKPYPYTKELYKGKNDVTKIGGFVFNNVTNNSKWEESNLNTITLNKNYLSFLNSNFQNMIEKHSWQVGGSSSNNLATKNVKNAYDYEIGSLQINSLFRDSYIGLMYISDYYYAISSKYWTYSGYTSPICSGDCYCKVRNENWLFLGLWEWLITPINNGAVLGIGQVGDVPSTQVIGYSNNYPAVRPTFYLKKEVKIISGTGTKDNPYRISI